MVCVIGIECILVDFDSLLAVVVDVLPVDEDGLGVVDGAADLDELAEELVPRVGSVVVTLTDPVVNH